MMNLSWGLRRVLQNTLASLAIIDFTEKGLSKSYSCFFFFVIRGHKSDITNIMRNFIYISLSYNCVQLEVLIACIFNNISLTYINSNNSLF
jgi:hypothetical protein